MVRARPVRSLGVVLCAAIAGAAPGAIHFGYDVARAHEIKPHRRTIPLVGVRNGFNQLHLTLTVSQVGEVLSANATGGPELMKYWPQLEAEVRQWKFTAFEDHGKPVTAEIDEYIDFVPPERLPTVHVASPDLRPDSDISIRLERGGCFGSCPSYKVTVSTKGVVFDGRS